MSERRWIPVNEPLISSRAGQYLQECLQSGWISSEGPYVDRLEAEMAKRVGRSYGMAVSSGSAALDVAVAALQVGPGDEVILPAFTIISCAAAVVRSGAVPVLVDSDAATWNMDIDQVEERITERTKGIMVVHIYGLPVDLDPVLEIAAKHGLWVIEDAAEMHGQEYRGRPCGGFGDVSVFSFYPNKLVTTGEGGIILTDDASLAERCRSLRNLCFSAERRFVHYELGWNYRMSNLQAALGVAQLEELDEFVAIKRRMGRRYQELLEGAGGVQTPVARTDYAENIYWVFGLVLRETTPFDAAVAMERLAEQGVGTRPFFWPMHEQPVFRRMGLFQGERHPVAERIARRGFYLPSGLALTDEQLAKAAGALTGIVR
ncbi:MAG: DegT/DnrJ/EryC1/StrS family aminotransferase [Bacillota bacterium]|nr:DegT/DnrJ/EryC1/StrS family aminotransferase [Bacillota bacterium]